VCDDLILAGNALALFTVEERRSTVQPKYITNVDSSRDREKESEREREREKRERERVVEFLESLHAFP
jgi:hypothetical protein